MDDIVKAALAKWPNVPDCYGWLGLDARGQWHMRDDRTQAAGPFVGAGASAASKGSWLRHDKLIEFIGRNYEADERGQWFFQNGPQRVYVELEVTPWVYRLHATDGVVTHTGRPTQATACLLDELGRVFLETPLGLGLVHSQDVLLAAEAIERGDWTPVEITSGSLPQRGGFVSSPASANKNAGTRPAS